MAVSFLLPDGLIDAPGRWSVINNRLCHAKVVGRAVSRFTFSGSREPENARLVTSSSPREFSGLREPKRSPI